MGIYNIFKIQNNEFIENKAKIGGSIYVDFYKAFIEQ